MVDRKRRHSFCPEALAYFAAGLITNMTEKMAANTLIIGLKDNDLWNRLDRIYLVSPTSVSAAKLCAKTLIGLVQGGGAIAFASTGLTFDGTANYLSVDVSTNQFTHLTQLNSCFTVYNRTQNPLTKNRTLVGVRTTTITGEAQIGMAAAVMQDYSFNTANTCSPAPLTAQGFHSLNRVGSFLTDLINGSVVSTVANTETSTTITNAFIFGAFNNAGTPINFTAYEFAFGSFGSSLSTTVIGGTFSEQQIFYNLIQAYQTALGRQV